MTLFQALLALSVGSSQVAWTEDLVRVEVVIERAVAALQSLKSEERVHALNSLAINAEHAVAVLPAIVDALSDPSREVRQAAGYTLKAFGPHARSATPELRRALADSWPLVRAAAASALGAVAQPTADLRRDLTIAIKSSYPEVRVEAACALARLYPDTESILQISEEIVSDAKNLLDKSLRKGDPSFVSRHAEALARIAPAVAIESVPELVTAALGDEEPAERARLALAVIGPFLAPFHSELLTGLSANDPGTRIHTVRTLAFLRLTSSEVLAGLIDTIQDDRPDVVFFAVKTCAALGPSAIEAVPALLDLFHSQEGELRRAAAFAVADISSTEANRLVEELKTSEPGLAIEIKKRILRSRL